MVVADGRPRFEGREMARHLVQAGIHTTYILVQSVSYIIREVTKVFLGAHAVFANGCVMSRVGTSQVALIAKAQNVPVYLKYTLGQLLKIQIVLVLFQFGYVFSCTLLKFKKVSTKLPYEYRQKNYIVA